jgi:hypothetical protein
MLDSISTFCYYEEGITVRPPAKTLIRARGGFTQPLRDGFGEESCRCKAVERIPAG